MKHIGITFIAILLLAGCSSQPVVQKQAQVVKKVAPIPQATPTLPPKPKKEHTLKEVEDTNYSSEYMYPESTNKKEEVKKPKATPLVTTENMNKEECIAMISQEKFDKYTAMFGSEEASVKRCNMIKAMNH